MSTIPLDIFSQQDVRLMPQRAQVLAEYFGNHFDYFARQRSKIIDSLKHAVSMHTQTFCFAGWQRVLTYEFSLEPLSARGSILNKPGGRFNVGNIDQIKFPRFSALYLAEDRETAYREKFGSPQKEMQGGLTSEELSLTSEASITIVSLKGEISQVLDICSQASLKDFYALIKEIKLPSEFVKRANKLNISPLYHVKTLQELRISILLPNWREMPMQFDVPANSQILGQIAHAAGIEAILYPSTKSKKKCLAVFPDNFSQSTSYIEIEDKVPAEIKCKRLDAQTYLLCV